MLNSFAFSWTNIWFGTDKRPRINILVIVRASKRHEQVKLFMLVQCSTRQTWFYRKKRTETWSKRSTWTWKEWRRNSLASLNAKETEKIFTQAVVLMKLVDVLRPQYDYTIVHSQYFIKWQVVMWVTPRCEIRRQQVDLRKQFLKIKNNFLQFFEFVKSLSKSVTRALQRLKVQ